jgi:uncharacterized protein
MKKLLRVIALSTGIASCQIANPATQPATQSQPSVSEIVQDALETLSPETVEAWRKKAESGDALAQNVLGMAYKYGIAVPQDHRNSLTWFRRAGEQGHPDAQFNLARIYGKAEGLYLKRGRVVPQDNVEAAKWLRRAADQGYLPAQAKLGELLMEGGHGLSADLVDAYYWLSKAASAGDAQAKKTLTDLTTKMTTEHLSAAKANAASKK